MILFTYMPLYTYVFFFLILQTNKNTLIYQTMYHTIEGNAPLPPLLVYDEPVCKHK